MKAEVDRLILAVAHLEVVDKQGELHGSAWAVVVVLELAVCRSLDFVLLHD